VTWLVDVENDLRELQMKRCRQRAMIEKNGNLSQRSSTFFDDNIAKKYFIRSCNACCSQANNVQTPLYLPVNYIATILVTIDEFGFIGLFDADGLWAGWPGLDYRQCKIYLFFTAPRVTPRPNQPPV
jgi:hypothetical protein